MPHKETKNLMTTGNYARALGVAKAKGTGRGTTLALNEREKSEPSPPLLSRHDEGR